jgi:hypothetical protein
VACDAVCAGKLSEGREIFRKRKLRLEQFAQPADVFNTSSGRDSVIYSPPTTRRIKTSTMPAETASPRSTLHDVVQMALSRSTQLAGRSLRFEVHEDGVVLRGVVRSYYHKQLAQESLRSISGLSRVTNELEVVSV